MVSAPPDGFLAWAINEKQAMYVVEPYEWIDIKFNIVVSDDMTLYTAWKKKWDEELGAKVFAEYEAGLHDY